MFVLNNSYQIKLPQFEGPFDLLLFFVERDELDIYNIPISKLINDFLDYIHTAEKLNIELASEFILFVSTLMRIKAKMLLPRKEIDAQGNEIDPRAELVEKILEYKKYKQAAEELALMENIRTKFFKRGNVSDDNKHIMAQYTPEGSELNNLTLFHLMRAFERVLKKMNDRNNKPTHIVERYNYTVEESRTQILKSISQEKNLSFEKIFITCSNRIQAIFLFFAVLELIQQQFIQILIGEGRNNFILEYIEPSSQVA